MPGFAERLKRDFAKNRKKAAILGVLSAVFALFLVKMYFDMQPKTASAESRVAPAAVQGSGTTVASSGGGESLQEKVKLSRELWGRLREKRGAAPATSFVLDTTYYTLDPSKRPVVNNVATATVETPVEKQPPRNAEEIARQARIATIREQARGLSLRSTVLGTKPVAIINGQIFLNGARVNGFEITSIRAREVELTKEGVSVVIKMADDARGQ